ncbi:MAG TPA: PEGA domain-containing protein, partial [Firmicutes bacterium]|nr:PEGA domain-containing protein [Bacillota bacterium]
RYKNHRGEYEWLTQEQIEKRKARRKRSGSKRMRESKSWIPQITSQKLDSLLGTVFSAALVLAIIATAVYLIARSGEVTSPYNVHVASQPPGAAIFIDGAATEKTTDAYIHVKSAGDYEVSVHLPGYRAIPSEIRVDLNDVEPTRSIVFSLYPQEPSE